MRMTLMMGALAAGLVSACATGVGADTYPRAAVGIAASVKPARIVAVRPVLIEGTKSGVGVATGAIVGGIAGSQVGGGRDENAIGAVVGGVLGGLAGAAIEENATQNKGFAYTVQIDQTGEQLVVVQGADVVLPVGALVYLEDAGRLRIVPR